MMMTSAAAGEDAADGGRHPDAAGGRRKVVDRLARREPCRKERSIPVRLHDLAGVARQFVGEVLAIACGNDLDRRIVPQEPRRKSDRNAMGLEAARREIDDQPSDFALPTIFETRSQKLDVRREQEAGLRIEVVEGALDEGDEVVPQQCGILARRDRLRNGLRRWKCDGH